MDVRVAGNELRRIPCEIEKFACFKHLHAPQVHLSVAWVKLCELKRSYAHKSHCKLKIVLFRIERLWVLPEHILEHCIDDELRLFVVDELCEAKKRVDPDRQDNEQAKHGSKLGLICRSTLKIHINLASKQVKLGEDVAESVALRARRFLPSRVLAHSLVGV